MKTNFLKLLREISLLLFEVFSNIPFNITAEIIDKLLKAENKPLEIYLVIQTEAAEKYIGDIGLETQSSILAKIFYDVEILGDIDRTAFTPKPQIKISFIKFVLKYCKFPFNPVLLLYPLITFLIRG